MGQLTRAELVTEAGQRASNTGLTTQCNQHLNVLLDKLYRGFDWPFLNKRYEDVALAQGATSLSFGAGTLETLRVKRIKDPIFLRTSDYSVTRRSARIAEYTEGRDTWGYDPALKKGIPNFFKISEDDATLGKWTLRADVAADRALLLMINYSILPDHIDTTSAGDTIKPRYPADETLILGLVVFLKSWDQDLEAKQEAVAQYEAAAGMDRVTLGQGASFNTSVGLDPNIFRR